MHRYKCFNGPMVTTAAQAAVTTGTAIKTHLQIATPSTRQIQLISWGFSVATTPTSGTNQIELLQTDVGATITQHVASGIQPLDPNAPASLMDISGVTKTGYTATVEGAITATRMFDNFLLPPTAGAYDNNGRYQFMLDERPIVAVSKFLRVRTDFDVAVPFICWVVWDE